MNRSDGSAVHVLLVEDHALLRQMLTRTLTEAGFEVTECASGEKGLALLEQGLRPRILLSDVRMPGIVNGIGLARAARKISPAIAVLLQTGYTDQVVHEFRVLYKPYDPEELIRSIAEILADGNDPRPPG